MNGMSRYMEGRIVTDRELIWWVNQYGNGIVIKGDLAKRIAIACSITGETPEEFVMKSIDKKIKGL
jgi:hypothetical protein